MIQFALITMHKLINIISPLHLSPCHLDILQWAQPSALLLACYCPMLQSVASSNYIVDPQFFDRVPRVLCLALSALTHLQQLSYEREAVDDVTSLLLCLQCSSGSTIRFF